MSQGWWHCCLNLEPSIAITQNYAPPTSAAAILRYLRAGDRAGDLISGVPPPLRPQMAERFEQVLRAHHPEALECSAKEAAADGAHDGTGQGARTQQRGEQQAVAIAGVSLPRKGAVAVGARMDRSDGSMEQQGGTNDFRFGF